MFNILVTVWWCDTDNCNDNSFHKQIDSNTCYDMPGGSEGTASTTETIVFKSPGISEGPASTKSTFSETFFSLGFCPFKFLF